MGVVLLLATITVAIFAEETNAQCPNIITRSEWGARATNVNALPVNPPPYVVIHHAASPGCTTKSYCSTLVKSFQNYHIDNNKWDDIGYHFLVGEDGNVYEGRGWGKMGTHAPNYNSRSIGICVIGTFTSKAPNDAALQAVKNLIECGISEGKIQQNYKLVGHKQVRDTECPGAKLYEEIQTWPHWTSKPQ